MNLIGEDRTTLQIKFIDYDGHIEWTGAPGEEFDVSYYMVEFANRDNVWVYKNIDCIT